MRDELAIWLTDSTFLILFIHKKYLLVRLLTNHEINGYEQSKYAWGCATIGNQIMRTEFTDTFSLFYQINVCYKKRSLVYISISTWKIFRHVNKKCILFIIDKLCNQNTMEISWYTQVNYVKIFVLCQIKEIIWLTGVSTYVAAKMILTNAKWLNLNIWFFWWFYLSTSYTLSANSLNSE